MLTWRTSEVEAWLERFDPRGAVRNRLDTIERRVRETVTNPLDLVTTVPHLTAVGDGDHVVKGFADGVRAYCRVVACGAQVIWCVLELVDHETYDRMNADPRARKQHLDRLVDRDALGELVRQSDDRGPEPLPAIRRRWIRPLGDVDRVALGMPALYEGPDVWSPASPATPALRSEIVQRGVDMTPGDTVRLEEADELVLGCAELEDGRRALFVWSESSVRPPFSLAEPVSLDQSARWAEHAYPLNRLVPPEDGSDDPWKAEFERRSNDVDRAGSPTLPLSAEEIRILRGFTQTDGMPLFLDGSAGSGKTTMLALALSLLAAEGDPVLFVTYSAALAATTRKRLERSLVFLHDLDSETAAARAAESVLTTREVFRRLLPEADRDRFAHRRLVTFARFRREFFTPTFRHNPPVDAEVAWIVLRGMIKGRGMIASGRVEPLEVGEFRALPDSWRCGVDEATFSVVAERVARPYQEWLDDHGFVDDQDLAFAARQALDPHHAEDGCYRAIVCDEAQDLTQAELRVLVRLLGVTGYGIRDETPVLPILFAGDPAQAVNPSGFRWESLTSMFSHETGLLFGADRMVTRGTTRLRKNYRSGTAIVGVARAVRSWLGDTVGTDESWDGAAGAAMTVRVEDAAAAVDLADALAIVIPCMEGGEASYVADDPVLSDVLAGSDLSNVYSPMAAKGLEFQRVCVYGFGRRFRQLGSRIGASGADAGVVGADPAVAYFANALYVAVTRAVEVLVFADPASEQLVGPDGVMENLRGIRCVEAAAGYAAVAGRAGERVATAKRLLERGTEERDVELLRRAAGQFRAAGDDWEYVAAAVADLVDGGLIREELAAVLASRPELIDALEAGLWSAAADSRDYELLDLLRQVDSTFPGHSPRLRFRGAAWAAFDSGARGVDLEPLFRAVTQAGVPGEGDELGRHVMVRMIEVVGRVLEEAAATGSAPDLGHPGAAAAAVELAVDQVLDDLPDGQLLRIPALALAAAGRVDEALEWAEDAATERDVRRLGGWLWFVPDDLVRAADALPHLGPGVARTVHMADEAIRRIEVRRRLEGRVLPLPPDAAAAGAILAAITDEALATGVEAASRAADAASAVLVSVGAVEGE